MQVTLLNIKTPRLSSPLPNILTSGCNSLPNLHTVAITNPSPAQSLPHPQSVSCLKLHYLPQYYDDWQWLASIQNLFELDVSFFKKKESSPIFRQLGHDERLIVSGQKVNSTNMSADGTGCILSNLPLDLSEKVSSCKGEVFQLTCIKYRFSRAISQICHSI